MSNHFCCLLYTSPPDNVVFGLIFKLHGSLILSGLKNFLHLISAILIIFVPQPNGGSKQVFLSLIHIFVISILYLSIIGPVLFAGLKILKPNEALVLTLFGRYYGTLKGEGFYFVNPFVSSINPAGNAATSALLSIEGVSKDKKNPDLNINMKSKKISLKTMTLNNEKQKINDALGNPITIGIVVIWRVVNTAKAVFNVDNYTEYLSIQCDSALRNIVRLYPYDTFGNDNEKTLRGSSLEIANKLREEIQEKVEVAGLEIIEAKITHLAYAPEIAAAMLQRQQACLLYTSRCV